jgi:hypothetical protein
LIRFFTQCTMSGLWQIRDAVRICGSASRVIQSSSCTCTYINKLISQTCFMISVSTAWSSVTRALGLPSAAPHASSEPTTSHLASTCDLWVVWSGFVIDRSMDLYVRVQQLAADDGCRQCV